MVRSILIGLLALAAMGVATPATATMTCDPALALVCTGDSGTDAYASCDGLWADAWALGFSYAQVCAGYDGVTHVYACPLAGDWMSPSCQHLTA